MVTASADDSAHGKPVFDRKVTEDTTPKDHRSDEEIAATIKEDQFALGSGTNVLPMTVGIARGKPCARSVACCVDQLMRASRHVLYK